MLTCIFGAVLFCAWDIKRGLTFWSHFCLLSFSNCHWGKTWGQKTNEVGLNSLKPESVFIWGKKGGGGLKHNRLRYERRRGREQIYRQAVSSVTQVSLARTRTRTVLALQGTLFMSETPPMSVTSWAATAMWRHSDFFFSLQSYFGRNPHPLYQLDVQYLGKSSLTVREL